MPDEVLQFWFRTLEPRQWWRVDAALDATVRERFGAVLAQAVAGELAGWRAQPQGRLAELVVLDQFSRNIHRGTPLAFRQDAQALALCQEAVAAGALQALDDAMARCFLLMPGMHSESVRVHAWVEPLFQAHTPPENHAFERRHQAIIERFGRYPHRNEILGRPSTPEELRFLQEPGSRF